MSKLPFEILVYQGKSLYQSKQYDAAIKIFDSAVKAAAKPEHRIDAIDLQIGALVKVKQYDDALKLAKSVIRVNRRDPRGYVRAAQIERLFHHSQAAARWYSQGLKHVSPSHKHYDLLKSGLLRCDALATSAAALSNRCDPFASLPVEIARSILQYLDYREMTALLRVSKPWRGFLQKEELITRTVDFHSAKSKVTITALKAALRRLSQYPKSAHLANLTDPATAAMNDRLPHWLRKNTIESYHSSMPFTDSMVSALPTAPALVQLSAPMSSQQTQTIVEKCRGLRKLTCIIDNAVDSFSMRHQQLEQLHLTQLQDRIDPLSFQLPNLQVLDLIRCDIQNVDLTAMAKLQTLRLQNCLIYRSANFPVTIQTLSMVNVRFLLNGPNDLDVPVLPHLTSMRADLTAWAIPLQRVVQGSPGLETLDIHDQDLTDSSVDVLASLPLMRDVAIRGARRITGVFVKDLMDRAENRIKRIKLLDCSKISLDTADWARQRYNIQIEIGTSDSLGNGRRVFTCL